MLLVFTVWRSSELILLSAKVDFLLIKRQLFSHKEQVLIKVSLNQLNFHYLIA